MSDDHQPEGLLDIFLSDEEIAEKYRDKPDPLRGIGLGLGASDRARELVLKGLEYEQLEIISKVLENQKRQPGRPSINDKRFTKHSKRAFCLYAMAERIKKVRGIAPDEGLEITLRKLIEETEKTFPTHGIFNKPKDFDKMRKSIKQGCKALGIEDQWRGPPLSDLLK